MREFLKVMAFVCKIGAVVFWLGTAWVILNLDIRDLRATSPPQYREAPRDWGTPAYFQRTYLQIAETVLLTLLALIPNRVLVSSRFAFAISLFVALIPLRVLAHTEFDFAGVGEILLSLFILVISVGMFSPLPASIVLSFLRFRSGEKVTYA